jgi:hypothetical protein
MMKIRGIFKVYFVDCESDASIIILRLHSRATRPEQMPIPAIELEQLHLNFFFKEFNVLFKDKDSRNEAPNSYKMARSHSPVQKQAPPPHPS